MTMIAAAHVRGGQTVVVPFQDERITLRVNDTAPLMEYAYSPPQAVGRVVLYWQARRPIVNPNEQAQRPYMERGVVTVDSGGLICDNEFLVEVVDS